MACDDGLTPQNGHSPVRAEGFEPRTPVVINEENIRVRLWRIATRSHVVRLTRNDDSGHARHAHNRPLASRKVNQ